ncbi:hypothetical protein HC660_30230 [Bacillus mojavensis]|uniref:Uncharacterized protein n=1 Tax=Bacillus mojavensis TaxID=72360 RepID=A0ABX6M008_BACMO|nr:hypothetical protein HC660_30230 [Bacillus mojavensis]
MPALHVKQSARSVFSVSDSFHLQDAGNGTDTAEFEPFRPASHNMENACIDSPICHNL